MQVPAFLLTQTCTISPYLGQSPSGPIYSANYDSICRFEFKRLKKSDDKGREYISKAILFLLPSTANANLEIGTQIVVDNKSYKVMEKSKAYGLSLSHIECVVV